MPEAQFWLGNQAVEAGDTANGLARFEQAARQGFAPAMFNLARLSAEAGDATAAEYWYTAAAYQGYGPAQFNLALALLDQGEAAAGLSWLIVAAEADVENAAAARDQVNAAVDIETRAEAEARATRIVTEITPAQ